MNAGSATRERTLPPPDFAYLRSEIDLSTLVSEYTPIHAFHGGEYRAACPIHGGRHLNFRIWQDTSHEWHYKCYSKCQAGGDAVTFLEQMEHISRADAVGQLYRRLGGHTPQARERRTTPAPRTPSEPLSERLVTPYVNCIDLPIDPTGQDPRTPRDWWHGQGVDDSAIDAYRLGFCPRCPMAVDPIHPERPMPSATIPIYSATNTVLNIRHRLLRPPSKKGDKYRPHARDLGAHLFNTGSLGTLPDGTRRTDRRIALIWEGEKKVIVGSSLQDWILGFFYPIVTATSGAGSWTSVYGDDWAAQFDDFERVVVMFDPGPDAILTAAEHTAALFGRRGCVIQTPQKVDDWLLGTAGGSGLTPTQRLDTLVGWIEDARPLRAESIWGGWA